MNIRHVPNQSQLKQQDPEQIPLQSSKYPSCPSEVVYPQDILNKYRNRPSGSAGSERHCFLIGIFATVICFLIFFLHLANDLDPYLYGDNAISKLPHLMHTDRSQIPKIIPYGNEITPYDQVNLNSEKYLQIYHKFVSPPSLVPTYNHTLHSELKSLEIPSFPRDVLQKERVLLNVYNQPQGLTTTAPEESSKSGEIEWIPWSQYIKDPTFYSSSMTPNRTSSQSSKKRFEARYATDISFSTNPPTIKFTKGFVQNPSSFYNRLLPLTAPINNKILDSKNRINTTNPFYEYLHLNSSHISQRRDAISREISHSMSGYSIANFGSDEFFPITQSSSRHWGLGLTIVDALDTLMLIENEEHVEMCLDFISNRLTFGKGQVSLFEISIRGLGGLLSAYALRPQHTVLLERAVELGELLLHAFDDGSTFPSDTYTLGQRPKSTSKTVTSHILSIQIEFETLARFTGESNYARGVRRLLRCAYEAKTPLLGQYIAKHTTRRAKKINGTGSMQDLSSDGENNGKQEPLRPAFDTLQTSPTEAHHVYQFDDTTISIGAKIDSSYEYYIKLWVLHGRPPYRLPIGQDRPVITWLHQEYTPSDQDKLWRKFDGLYAKDTGVYIPLGLYFEFLQKFPSILQKSSTESLLFSPEITKGLINPKLGHLDCFMGGTLSYGIAHGVLDDDSMINELYKVVFIHRESGIPYDFVTSLTPAEQRSKRQSIKEGGDMDQPANPWYYSLFQPNLPHDNDRISAAQYVRIHHQQWANDLTHTCAQAYGKTPSQIAPEESQLVISPKLSETDQIYLQTYETKTQTPEIQDLYEYFRFVNTLPSDQQSPMIPIDHYLYTGHSRRLNASSISNTASSPLSTGPSSSRLVVPPRWSPPGQHWVRAHRFSSPDPNTGETRLPLKIPPMIEVVENSISSATPPSTSTSTPLQSPPPQSPAVDIKSRSSFRNYFLRPETVESLYYLWKTTRHEYYRETIWAIFLHIVFYCRIYSGGYSSLSSVDITGFVGGESANPPQTPPLYGEPTFDTTFRKQFQPQQPSTQWLGWAYYHSMSIPHEQIVSNIGTSLRFDHSQFPYGYGPRAEELNYWYNATNKQETWFIAETLKYIWLSFADDDILPLDKWVFNTEAHPVPI